MKVVSIRNSGKFPQSIQYLLWELWKRKRMKKDCICYRWPFKPAANLTWCRTADLCLLSGENLQEMWTFLELSQTILTFPSSVYLQRYSSRDRLFRETNKQTKEVIRTMWWEGSLMTSHTSLIILQSFKGIISMWKTEPSRFVCCRFQRARTMVCSNISHQDTKSLSLCL